MLLLKFSFYYSQVWIPNANFITTAKEVLFSPLSIYGCVYLFVCKQDYAKSTNRISTKLDKRCSMGRERTRIRDADLGIVRSSVIL